MYVYKNKFHINMGSVYFNIQYMHMYVNIA